MFGLTRNTPEKRIKELEIALEQLDKRLNAVLRHYETQELSLDKLKSRVNSLTAKYYREDEEPKSEKRNINKPELPVPSWLG